MKGSNVILACLSEVFPTALEGNTTHETCSWPRPFIVGRGEAVFGFC